MHDVRYESHGSLCLFRLLTDAARNWVEENVNEPNYFGNALVCEPRYAYDLVTGMREGGLRVA